MRIGIAQIETRAGDLEGNVERLGECARRAAEKGVELLIFPMAALVGVTPVQSADREGFLLDLMETLAPELEDLACPCLIPMVLSVDGSPLPEALLVEGREIKPVRLSARLSSTKGRDGGDPSVDALPELPFHGARLGVAFTYEDLDAYDDYEYDVDVIVFLSGYGFAADDPSSALGAALQEGRFVADAEATGAWIVAAGSLGCYDAQVFCGSSFVLAPWGELAAQAPSFEEDLLVYDVDPSAEGPLPEPLAPEVYDAPLMTWGALSAGLSGLVRGAHGRTACSVVGPSLSDALLAVLAVDALGPMNVFVVVPKTGEREKDEACLGLVRALRLPEENVERVNVSGAQDAAAARDLAELALAALARRTGGVALGSRDKTGWALDPCSGTLSAALVEPFADLYRSDLLELSRVRSMISPVIPMSLLGAYGVPEVAGVRDAFDSDEAALEFMDLVLVSYVEWERPVSDIVSERGHAEETLAVIGRMRELEVTRPSRPLALTLSSRTLDEARSPLGFAWRDRVREQSERMGAFLGSVLSESNPPDEERQEPEPPISAPTSGEIRDIMGHLRDFSVGGAFSAFGLGREQERGATDDRPGGPGQHHGHWEGPFSEN